MAAHHIDAGVVYNPQLNWENLTSAYGSLYESYSDELKEHCDEYEELTLEDKILIDEDMEYLKEHSDCLGLSRNKLAIEECLIELRRRERRKENK